MVLIVWLLYGFNYGAIVWFNCMALVYGFNCMGMALTDSGVYVWL